LNEHSKSKRLNQRGEYLPRILYLKHARTFLALADALDLDLVGQLTDSPKRSVISTTHKTRVALEKPCK
jgi:hypothetical protein